MRASQPKIVFIQPGEAAGIPTAEALFAIGRSIGSSRRNDARHDGPVGLYESWADECHSKPNSPAALGAAIRSSNSHFLSDIGQPVIRLPLALDSVCLSHLLLPAISKITTA